MSVDTVLYSAPWIPYNDTLLRSRLVLEYPKNLVFTAQLLSRVQSSDVYDRHPEAETFDPSLLQNVDWRQSLIVVDPHSHLLLAPEPVRRLVLLDRRLHYRDAAEAIFSPFRFLAPMHSFRYQWLCIAILVVASFAWLRVTGRNPYSLVLSSRVRASEAPPRR